jgi:Arylsulfotransferase (ASST)
LIAVAANLEKPANTPHVSDRVAAIIFVACLFFLTSMGALLFGIGVGKFEIWPYDPLRVMYAHFTSFIHTGKWAPEARIVPRPEGASGKRVALHRADALMPGYRAIMGWDDGVNEHTIWLLDATGQQVHSWTVDYSTLDVDEGDDGDTPHGMKVLEDGSVLVNFDGGHRLARLDACGKPIWIKKDGIYHHSIERAEDGSFWTWRADGSAYSADQHLLNFDPATGATLREYSLIDDFILGSPAAAVVFGLPADFQPYDRQANLFHPNDIEPLHSALADRFPDFRPGDLLVSLKASNLVAVLDPVQKRLKWWSHGPWRLQHDPDFGADGKIWVYNNQTVVDQSNIISIDPRARNTESAFSNEESRFFSETMGKHQLLPNGNLLIVVPDEGRVLETKRSGDLVFEFNNLFDDGYNAHVENALWLPEGFFASFPSCPRR